MKYAPLSVVRTEASQYYSNLHLSIYIPIGKGSNGSFQSRNKLRFCMSLKKIEKKLLDKGFSFIKVRELMHPLELKLESGIWRRNCSGVAIFYKSNITKIFTLDQPLPQMEFVGEHFFVDPLRNGSSETCDRILNSLEELNREKESQYIVAWQ